MIVPAASAVSSAALSPALVLAAAEVTQNPIVIGLVVGLPTAVLGFLGYRRSRKLDKIAAQAAAATASSTNVQTLVSGLNEMIDKLQDDNKVLRQNFLALTEQYNGLRTDHRELRKLVDDMGIQINGA